MKQIQPNECVLQINIYCVIQPTSQDTLNNLDKLFKNIQAPKVIQEAKVIQAPKVIQEAKTFEEVTTDIKKKLVNILKHYPS